MPPAPAAGRTGGGFCCPAAPCAQSARQPSHRKQGCTQSHRRLPILRLPRWETAEAAAGGEPGRGAPVPRRPQRARLRSSSGEGFSRGNSFFSPPQPALPPQPSAGYGDTTRGVHVASPPPLSPKRGEKKEKLSWLGFSSPPPLRKRESNRTTLDFPRKNKLSCAT